MTPEDFFKGLFESMQQQPDSDYEILGPLAPTDAAEWKELQAEHLKIKNEAEVLAAKAKMVEAKRELFWCRVEHNTEIYDKNMRIIDGNLYVEKDKE